MKFYEKRLLIESVAFFYDVESMKVKKKINQSFLQGTSTKIQIFSLRA